MQYIITNHIMQIKTSLTKIEFFNISELIEQYITIPFIDNL